MIVADSSVWISLFRKDDSDVASTLRSLIPRGVILLGDIILMEVLHTGRQGYSSSALDRTLRARDFTTSKAPDLIIGTYWIENGHSLLQRDKDYLPMVEHPGLKLA